MNHNAFRILGGVIGAALVLSAAPAPRLLPPSQQPPLWNQGLNVRHDDHMSWDPEGDRYGDERLPGNEIELVICWYEPTASPNQRRTFQVWVAPTMLVGQCSNSGEGTFADYAIRQARNDGWGGQPLEPDWVFDSANDIIDYAPEDYGNPPMPGGLQTLYVRSRPVRSGEALTLRISSYDWMGFCTITVTDGEQTLMHDCPEDADTDRIPDVREQQQPVSGKPDDQDRDTRVPYVHEQPGDGLPAGLEKRGILRFGTVTKTEDLPDNAGSGNYGGPAFKDVFINYTGIEQDPGPFLFPNPNPYLYDHGVVWHLIRSNEIDADGGLAGWMIDTDGPVRRVQRTIRIVDVTPITTAGGLRRVGQSNTSVMSGIPVQVDSGYIQDRATAWGIPYATLMGWTIAHELGHKLSLPHNEELRTYVGPMPNPEPAPSFTTFYTTPNTSNVVFWVRSSGSQTLEFLNRLILPTGVSNGIATNSGAITVLSSYLQVYHDSIHNIGRYPAALNAGVQSANPLQLVIEAHLGNLMDPVLRSDEVDLVRDDPLPPNMESQIKIIN